MNRFQTLLVNPHTSFAGAIILCLQVAQIWLPEKYDAKLDKTSLLLAGYAGIMAADSKKGKNDPENPAVSNPPPAPTK